VVTCTLEQRTKLSVDFPKPFNGAAPAAKPQHEGQPMSRETFGSWDWPNNRAPILKKIRVSNFGRSSKPMIPRSARATARSPVEACEGMHTSSTPTQAQGASGLLRLLSIELGALDRYVREGQKNHRHDALLRRPADRLAGPHHGCNTNYFWRTSRRVSLPESS
jgi:hypothetical protein